MFGQKHQLPVEWIDTHDILSRTQVHGALAAVYNPTDGSINPQDLIYSFRQQLKADIFEHTPVTSIMPEGGGFRVKVSKTSSQKDFTANSVIVATNAFTSQLFPEKRQHFEPCRAQCLQTHPVQLRLHGNFYFSDKLSYLRQTPKGELVCGGLRTLDLAGEKGIEDRLHPEIQSQLEVTLKQLFPQEVIRVQRRWSGPMAFNRQSSPHFRAVRGVLWALLFRKLLWAWDGHGFFEFSDFSRSGASAKSTILSIELLIKL